jgi:hypothetical protein
MSDARSESSAVVKLNSSVFCVITQRKMVSSRRFGTTYQSHIQGFSCTAWPLKTEPIGNTKTSVSNSFTPSNNLQSEKIITFQSGFWPKYHLCLLTNLMVFVPTFRESIKLNILVQCFLDSSGFLQTHMLAEILGSVNLTNLRAPFLALPIIVTSTK